MTNESNNLKTIYEQLDDRDLDMNYRSGANLYRLNWETDAELGDVDGLKRMFENVQYFHLGQEVPEIEEADEVIMKDKGRFRRRFRYDENQAFATAAVEPGRAIDLVEIVGVFEGWGDLHDNRDRLWQLISSELDR